MWQRINLSQSIRTSTLLLCRPVRLRIDRYADVHSHIALTPGPTIHRESPLTWRRGSLRVSGFVAWLTVRSVGPACRWAPAGGGPGSAVLSDHLLVYQQVFLPLLCRGVSTCRACWGDHRLEVVVVAGSVFKRCGCRDAATGRLLGARCALLLAEGHGSWYFSVELPTGVGRRHRLRRGGFASETVAAEALARLADPATAGAGAGVTVRVWLDRWL